MEIPSIEPFVGYYTRLRHRTTRVAACIPATLMDWRPAAGAFSFADVLRHLGAIERWVFAENACLRPSRYPGHGADLADGADAVMAFLARMHAETIDILGGLTPADLKRECLTPAGSTIPVWKWLRALTEHEVHHRGQLYLMLRLNGVATPPMWGVTSEQVRANSEPLAQPT